MACERCNLSPTPYRITVVKDKDDKVWMVCDECLPTLRPNSRFGQSSMIATDDIPGGLEVKHGLCHEDGTPQKFYSKSDIRRAAFETGWTISGETPKPNQRLKEAKLAKAEGMRLS